jgi:hypothetical protein
MDGCVQLASAGQDPTGFGPFAQLQELDTTAALKEKPNPALNLHRYESCDS